MYSAKEKQLAQDITDALHDPLSYGLYLGYSAVIPHDILRQKLAYVLNVPDEKILNSRAAYFIHLIEQHKEFGNGGSRN